MAKIKGKDVKFALISLKAGSARLGHVLTQLAQYVGQTISASPAEKSSSKKVKKEELNEGFLDTISNSIKNAIDKIKTIPEIAKNYFSSFINAINPFTTKITNFFFKELNADVNQLQSTELKNLERIENDLERELGTIDEGSSKCDKQHASYTSTVDKNLTLFKNVLKSNTEDISLINKITELSNNDSLIPFNSDSIDSIDNIHNIFSSVSRDNRNNNRKISINNNNVEIIRYLENDDYDKLLKSNIVFIKLLGASAVNTVIECVVRNTPIIINKLPAIVEVLGEHYPLYYNTLEEATNIITIKNIEKAYNYLKKMDKSQLKMESFNKNFEDILKQLKY
jgi:hypothetical protein